SKVHACAGRTRPSSSQTKTAMLLKIVTPGLIGALVLATSSAAVAQTPTVTEADYARAGALAFAQPLIDHAVTRVTWLDATHLVYTDHDASGDRLLQTDTATGKTAPLFD